MIEIFILLGLIILNGIFSMSEIALVSARKARLEAQANKGDKKAQEALTLANHPDTFLSTVQIGITLIGILTGIYSGDALKGDLIVFLNTIPTFAPYSSALATAIIVIPLTYVTLVLGELVPKRLGLTSPESIAKAVAGPMRVVSFLSYPFIFLLSKSTNLITKLFKITANENQVTEEEIKAIINEGTEHGAIEEAEQEIIERVFHLGDRNITSIMTHRSDIIWFNISDNEASIREKIMENPHSIYPVCDQQIDEIKGYVSLKDMYVSNDLTQFKHLMRPALFVPENNTAYQVLERFKLMQAHSCFVVDEYGSLLGMITLNDIMEAIVGDINEPNQEDYEITPREDGSFLVDAQIPFYDFLSHFEKTQWMNEGEHEFDTLAGFMLHELEHIPITGESLEWKGFTFEIVDMDGHRIDKILVGISDDIRSKMD